VRAVSPTVLQLLRMQVLVYCVTWEAGWVVQGVCAHTGGVSEGTCCACVEAGQQCGCHASVVVPAVNLKSGVAA
jgi:hypothetical protein